MSTPNPEEITAALAVLRRIPDISDQATLGAIERSNSPLRWMARDLHAQLAVDFPDQPGTLAIALSAAAARHGLRITTDPESTALAFGELVGYAHIRPPITADRSWFLRDGMTWGPTLESLSDARACVSAPSRVVALHLLPEGGKA